MSGQPVHHKDLESADQEDEVQAILCRRRSDRSRLDRYVQTPHLHHDDDHAEDKMIIMRKRERRRR